MIGRPQIQLMIEPYGRHVLRAVLSVAIALAGAAGVVASSWALQAAALPPPKPAARVAADASVWLHDYRLAVDVFHFDHRRVKGACIRGWFPRRHEAKARASLLSFEAGPVLRVSPKRSVPVTSPRRGRRFPPPKLAADAGCSRLLASVLGAAAQSGGNLSEERAFAANRPAVALEMRRGRHERLTLFVSPRTDHPLVSFVAIGRRTITSRIYLQRATRHVLRHFRLLHLVKPEPTR